jgi:capsid protein
VAVENLNTQIFTTLLKNTVVRRIIMIRRRRQGRTVKSSLT